MPESFDPYYKWLGIPPKDQPPNHYRLLGVETFESDREVIDSFANRHIEYLQQITDGPHVRDAQRVLNELAAARRCLLDPKKKKAYDKTLKQESTPPAAVSIADVAEVIPIDDEAPAKPKRIPAAVTTPRAVAVEVTPIAETSKPPLPSVSPTPAAPNFGVKATAPGGANRIRKPKKSNPLTMVIVGGLAVLGLLGILGAILLVSYLNPAPPEEGDTEPPAGISTNTTDDGDAPSDDSDDPTTGGGLSMSAPTTKWLLKFDEEKDNAAATMNLKLAGATITQSGDDHKGVLTFPSGKSASATCNNPIKSTTFSVSFWFKPSKLGPKAAKWNDAALLIGGGPKEWGVSLADGEMLFGSVATSSQLKTFISNESVAIKAGEWTHCVAAVENVRGRSIANLYINGEGMAAIKLPNTIKQPGVLRLGAAAGKPKATFEGSIDDVRFFNQTLTPLAVKDLFDDY